MTVAELIEELKRFPQHHPVVCDVDMRYNQSVVSINTAAGDMNRGPAVVLCTEHDPRNDPEPDFYDHAYDGGSL